MPLSPTDLQPPKGSWTVSIQARGLRAQDPVGAGVEARVVVQTLCGEEDVRMTVAPKTSTTASELARRVQIVASIHHPSRRACEKCLNAFSTLNRFERALLYSGDAKEGQVLGIKSEVDG